MPHAWLNISDCLQPCTGQTSEPTSIKYNFAFVAFQGDASIQHDFVLLCDVVTACMKSDYVAPALFTQVGVSVWKIRRL